MRDRGTYYLNISYPSLQAMRPLAPEEIIPDALGQAERQIALYIHIPFCSGICGYCHYYKLARVGAGAVNSYIDSLALELSLYGNILGPLVARSIYIGGGTPSYLSASQIERLFRCIHEKVRVADGSEITFEIHPADATPKLLATLSNIGVNRVSIGIESFEDDTLTLENRRHSAAQAVSAYECTLAAGIKNVNLDLIYGLRGQTVSGWERNLLAIEKLRPPSFCAYYLRLKMGTVDFKRARRDPPSFPSEPDLLLMHIMTSEYMRDLGYLQLIVDWFVRDDRYVHKYQAHNWQSLDSVELLGLGASAYSYVSGIQYYNVNDVRRYSKSLEEGRLPVWRGERLATQDEQMRRTLMLGLKSRVSRKTFFDKYGVDVILAFPEQWRALAERGLVRIDDNCVELSDVGKLFADEVGWCFYSKEMRERMKTVEPARISTTLPHLNQF